jgi:ABC-type uncharacterized transport system substrate-binding protein
MIRFLFCWLCIAVLIIGHPVASKAHPHVWIDYSATVVFDNQQLVGFEMEWIIDPMLSEQIIHENKLDQGLADAKQTEAVRTGFFDNLRHYNYFTHIWVDDWRFLVKVVEDFTVEVRQRQVVYRFFVPCVVPVESAPQSVRLIASDPEIFVDFRWQPEKSVQIKKNKGVVADAQLVRESSRSLIPEFVTPLVLQVDFRADS